jgi:hypothetical protein
VVETSFTIQVECIDTNGIDRASLYRHFSILLLLGGLLLGANPAAAWTHAVQADASDLSAVFAPATTTAEAPAESSSGGVKGYDRAISEERYASPSSMHAQPDFRVRATSLHVLYQVYRI